jgi:hypothetical protein
LDSSSTTFVRRACRGDELTLFCNARLRRARYRTGSMVHDLKGACRERPKRSASN